MPFKQLCGERLFAIVGANKHGSLSFNEMFLSWCPHLAFWNLHFGSENGDVFTGLVLFQDHIPLLCLLVALPGEHLFGTKKYNHHSQTDTKHHLVDNIILLLD